MANPLRTYRVWRDGRDWRWQIIDAGQVIAHGYEATSVKARAQAMLFALSGGTADTVH